MLAMMGCDTNLRGANTDAEQASRAFTGSPLAGVRIVSDDGVFALSEAEPPKGFSSQSIGTLAWWNDASSQQLFLYSRLVITPSDMGHALLNLERDLGIDSSFTNESAELKQAISKAMIEPPDPTTWQPATYTLALEIMGFDPSEFVDAVKALDPLTPDCRLVKSIVTTEASMKSAPSQLKAILLASQASCGHGCNCTTLNECRTARCVGGQCTSTPVDDPCCAIHCATCFVCDGGTCVKPDPCCGVTCGDCESCSGGSCVQDDPCCGVICNDCESCSGGTCVQDDLCCGVSCPDCTQCSQGACITTDLCCGVTCSQCSVCEGGSCIQHDPCCGVTCGDCESCSGGTCVQPDPCCGVTCGDCKSCSGGSCVQDDLCCGVSCPTCKQCSQGACITTDPCCGVTCSQCFVCEGGDCIQKVNCSTCGGGYCLGGVCQPRSCNVSLSSATGCAGSAFSMDVTASCSAASTTCGDNVAWNVSESSPDVSLSGSGSFTCPSGSGTVNGSISTEATSGSVPVNITGNVGGSSCNSSGSVTIDNRVDLTFAGVADADETTVGGFVCLNDNDNNGDGTPDKDDAGPTMGENDLQPLTISLQAGLTGNVSLSVINSKIRLYGAADRSNPLGTSPSWSSTELTTPKTIYVEGIARSASARDVEIIATYTGDGGPCVDKIKLTVYQVTSLVWETKQNSGNEAIDVGMNNGGKRIFPGKKSANDADPGGNRRQVDLVATITPAVADRNVHFGVWDVDDPFDQDNAGMANVGLIDSNTSGPDNRPTGEAPWSNSALTMSDGTARVTFTVSMQPGNNYRAGATCLTGTVSAVTQTTADEQNPNGGSWSDYALPLRWSEMLTVWRKLHVEVDSMGPGSDLSTLMNRNLDATALEDAHQGPNGGHSWAEINGWSVQQEGRLEDGTLTVTGGGTYTIVDNIADFGDDSVYVEGSILVDEDKLASATDDDAPFVPRAADTSLMNVKYQPAYIEIQLHPEESQLNIPFVANLLEADTDVVPATAPGRSSTFLTSADYWVVQIVTCFQGKDDRDHDPDDIYHFWTGTDFKHGDSSLYGQTVDEMSGLYNNVSMIFLETIRDRSAWSVFFSQFPEAQTALLNAADVERITVVHEVGHQFGLQHTSGLMDGKGAENPNLVFSADDILIMRSTGFIGDP